jgi:hypothetical protein
MTLFERTALPQPGIIGGAVRTRRQLKGLQAEQNVAHSITQFVNKSHGKGKVSERTTAAIHKFAGLWGELAKRKIQLAEHLERLLQKMRSARKGQSQEVQALQGEVRQVRRQHQAENGKLARLSRWFDKNVKRKMSTGGEALAGVLKQAMAASQSFVDVLKTLSPAGLFSAMWSKVSRWWNGPSTSHGTSHGIAVDPIEYRNALHEIGAHRRPRRAQHQGRYPKGGGDSCL